MKRILTLCIFAASLLAAIVSCEKPQTGYSGINYIILSSSSNIMYDTPDDKITVEVMLSTSVSEDLELMFKVKDDPQSLITVTENPVVIKAGSKTASFTISSGPLSSSSQTFTIILDESVVLPDKMAWKEDYVFTVNSSQIAPLTEEQKAIIAAYKESTGIDLTGYIGLIPVTTVYSSSNPDDESIKDETFQGYTLIELSEESTMEQPVLKMKTNPMGMTDALYKKLRALTVENLYWLDENAYQSYSQLMEAISWDRNSDETFSVTLDGIKPKTDMSIEFVATSYSDYLEYDMTIVPFKYEFSAYEREKQALEEGKIGTAVDEFWAIDATANPAFHLNCDDTSEDRYETGNWTESSSSLNAEKMTFTFCIYNYNDYDYSKVVATYTPNK